MISGRLCDFLLTSYFLREQFYSFLMRIYYMYVLGSRYRNFTWSKSTGIFVVILLCFFSYQFFFNIEIFNVHVFHSNKQQLSTRKGRSMKMSVNSKKGSFYLRYHDLHQVHKSSSLQSSLHWQEQLSPTLTTYHFRYLHLCKRDQRTLS
uniref:Uncharacterized protein n=1 Tax=Cacopsylla melanoneura TaxID=428564 RepID=A0A8D9ED59_9HEMI